MTELKYGGSDVKIMYGSQEIGGATKLEPGTILYMSSSTEKTIKNLHLLSTTKNWNNLNGINVGVYSYDFSTTYVDVDISSDDFKNLDTEKKYTHGAYTHSINISTSIVDGEYRLNLSVTKGPITFLVKAI